MHIPNHPPPLPKVKWLAPNADFYFLLPTAQLKFRRGADPRPWGEWRWSALLMSRSQCTGNRSLHLVRLFFPIQTTWRYSHCTCIWTHKLWKYGQRWNSPESITWSALNRKAKFTCWRALIMPVVKWRYICLAIDELLDFGTNRLN